MIGPSCLLSVACACAHLSILSALPHVCPIQALLSRLFLLCCYAFCQFCLTVLFKITSLVCSSHALLNHEQCFTVCEHPLPVATLPMVSAYCNLSSRHLHVAVRTEMLMSLSRTSWAASLWCLLLTLPNTMTTMLLACKTMARGLLLLVVPTAK